jgi:hypothetical protein
VQAIGDSLELAEEQEQGKILKNKGKLRFQVVAAIHDDSPPLSLTLHIYVVLKKRGELYNPPCHRTYLHIQPLGPKDMHVPLPGPCHQYQPKTTCDLQQAE